MGYDKTRDFGVIDTITKKLHRQELGIGRLSLNEAYRHYVRKQKKQQARQKAGLHNFSFMHTNLINQTNNKYNSDIAGHLGRGHTGLSGSPPQRDSEPASSGHGHRFVLNR